MLPPRNAITPFSVKLLCTEVSNPLLKEVEAYSFSLA